MKRHPQLELGKEYPAPDEAYWIRQLTERLRARMEMDYPDNRMLRDAHPKQHACVRAEFAIESELPTELAVGLFAKPKTYPAWIRFSNSAPLVRSDAKRDIRGMAIKLMDVEGPKALGETGDGRTQDFLMLSCPIFLTRDVAQFDAFVEAVNGGARAIARFFLNPFQPGLPLLFRILKTAKPCASLLDTRFWSTTPIAFADRSVKYTAIPRNPKLNARSDATNPDFLRERLGVDLAANEACFDFCVQLQTDPERMPIEDPTVEWPESNSPFQKVATIRIPVQEIDDPKRSEFGDDLSFNPWHCLAEHRPLGGINRGRKEIYAALSEFRHKRNGATLEEPSPHDFSH